MSDYEEIDSYEAQLLKDTMAPFNSFLPKSMPEVDSKVRRALNTMGLAVRNYKTAYASNMLWTIRNYIEDNPIAGWVLKKPENCLHLVNLENGLTAKITKSFAFTGGLSPAGHNELRRTAYIQDMFRTEEEIRTLLGGHSLDGRVVQVTWTRSSEGVFSFMAYVPKDAGNFPKSPDARIAFSIGISENEYDNLSFATDEDAPVFVQKKNIIIERDINKSKATKETGTK